ncbi:MAG: glycerate kinase, partial [Lentisphaeria bacterium]|nr:glycerate kinase [Lentisphaeria bacterium]
MKIILAPDKVKSTMTSPQLCAIMEKAFHDVFPDWQIISLPLADGGDGTTRALAAATGAELRTVRVM